VTVAGVPIADWRYDFAVDGDVTTVVESWDDRRPGWLDRVSQPMMGVADRGAHNLTTMRATLANLKEAAEVGH
jgi:hypothetical protein